MGYIYMHVSSVEEGNTKTVSQISWPLFKILKSNIYSIIFNEYYEIDLMLYLTKIQ